MLNYTEDSLNIIRNKITSNTQEITSTNNGHDYHKKQKQISITSTIN